MGLSTEKMQMFIINAISISNVYMYGLYYVLKKLLVKTVIVFISIYFEPYCKILARSNKSVPKSFYTKFIYILKAF